MSISPMAGRALNSWTNPGYGQRSHSSETAQADICRGTANAQAFFQRLAHKRSRVLDRHEVQAQTQEWLRSLSAEFADEAEELVRGYWQDAEAQENWESFVEESERIAAMLQEFAEEDEAYLAGLSPAVFDDSLLWELQSLDFASSMTLEEANTAGLRITNKPSGYTYGRS